MPDFLPYGHQTIEADDVAATLAAVTADYLTSGPEVAAYEDAFARASGATFAVACSSGTAALHLAMLALRVGPGDAVIVPSLTFLATANVVRMTGAEIVFADVDAVTALITPDTLSRAIAEAGQAGLNVVGAIPVHLNGLVCDMEALAAVAARGGIWLVEDACHALGVPGIGAAAYSRAACFSTHPVKAVTTGEGGVVTTSEPELAERARLLRSHGMSRAPEGFVNRELAFEDGAANPWYYEMAEIGWNYRISDLACALGISQIGKLGRFHGRRREIAAGYERLLAPLAPVLRPVARATDRHGWHLYAVLIDFPTARLTRRALMLDLQQKGIGSQVHYIPLHRQPYYRERYGTLHLPGADSYYARCLSIPMFPALADADVARVAGALADALQPLP